jgi:hypothetical protein
MYATVSMSLKSGLQLQSGTWAWGKGESLNSKRSMEMVAEANGAVDAFLSFQVCRGDSKALSGENLREGQQGLVGSGGEHPLR